jgi:hypothetical protein
VISRLRYSVGTRLGRPRRWRYLEQLPKGGVGAEIGVYRGDFSIDLLRVTRARKLHLIDAWWTLAETYDQPWFETNDTREAYEIARARLEGWPVVFHVGDDCEILRTFPYAYFDWVYLDTLHTYEHTVQALEILRLKMRPTGIIAGHDWFEDPSHAQYGVVPAVREFCDRYQWRLGARDLFDQWSVWPS